MKMKGNKQPKQVGQTVLLWHPNFRVVEALPDTKAVRTSFLVNALPATLLVIASVFLVLREQELASVRNKAVAAEKDVAEHGPKSQQALQLQKGFVDAEKRLQEIEKFSAKSFPASVFLRQVAQTLPRLIALDSIDMQGGLIHLRGLIVGSSERAPELAKSYLGLLIQDEVLAQLVQDIRLKALNRDSRPNRFVFEIEMKVKSRG